MEIKPTMDRPVYYIRHWGKHFENHATRQVDNALRWVASPTKHDGKGFRRVSRLINAVPVFCAWNLIYQVAAKCPIRGVLADEEGPLTPLDLSDGTGYPEEIFEQAFKALADDRIGWLGRLESGRIGSHPDASGPVTLQGQQGTQDREDKEDNTNREDMGGGDGDGLVRGELIRCGVSSERAGKLSKQQGLTPAIVRFAFRHAEAQPAPKSGRKNPPAFLCKLIEQGTAIEAAKAAFEAKKPADRAKHLIPFLRAGDVVSIAGTVIDPAITYGQNGSGLHIPGSSPIPPELLVLAQIVTSKEPPRPLGKGQAHAA